MTFVPCPTNRAPTRKTRTPRRPSVPRITVTSLRERIAIGFAAAANSPEESRLCQTSPGVGVSDLPVEWAAACGYGAERPKRACGGGSRRCESDSHWPRRLERAAARRPDRRGACAAGCACLARPPWLELARRSHESSIRPVLAAGDAAGEGGRRAAGTCGAGRL